MDDIDVIAAMQDELNPKNMSEFEMGMHFATLIDAVTTGAAYDLDKLLEHANRSMDYWFDKYEDDLAAMDVGEEAENS